MEGGGGGGGGVSLLAFYIAFCGRINENNGER